MGKIKTDAEKFEHLIVIYSRLKIDEFKRSARNPILDKKFALISLVVLIVTSLFWSIQGSILQSNNADQVVDPYLFESAKTFHGANFPASHSLLIKWPLFWLTKLFGVSHWSLGVLTVLASLGTVLFLAYILYKIERRSVYFGVLCLMLASVLMLVPAQPYAGALLPVNMAMLTTRNLEYVVYIGSLLLMLRSSKIKSWIFGSGLLLMSLLVASDRLFLIIGLGGALLSLIFYVVRKEIVNKRLSLKWLIHMVASGVIAWLLIALINTTGLTHIASQGGLGPFGVEHQAKNIALGVLYAFLGLLTNFGANPAYDASIVSGIPSHIKDRLLGLGSLGFIVNLIVFGLATWSAWQLLTKRPKISELDKNLPSRFPELAKLLIFSSLAAILAFIFSNHYYAVDARYLTVILFGGFISLAIYMHGKNWGLQKLILVGEVTTLGIIFAIGFSIHSFTIARGVQSETNSRNKKISSVIKQHPVTSLVGDYWRVLPIKFQLRSSVNVLPTLACSTNLQTLSSSAWQVDLKRTSFAYLISYDNSLTGYKNCSLNQVIDAYGRPNSSSLISGTLSHPREQILFYDKGSNRSSPTINPPAPQQPATVLPITLDKLPNTSCQTQTIMVTAAHQDDDLLFMNPDILHAIDAGKCIRVVFFTAGDAGSNQFYWLGRELGSEAAYAKMLNFDDIWIKRIVSFSENRYIRVDNPRGNSKISLIFIRLPDGSPRGGGYKTTNFESLEKLESGKISSIKSVDAQSDYTYKDLVNTLILLMRTYNPAEVKTQSTFADNRYPDHSDHTAVAKLTNQAVAEYDNRLPIKHYVGYSIYARPENVFGNDLKRGNDAFFAYAKYDQGVCNSEVSCQNSKASYGYYLHREYTAPE